MNFWGKLFWFSALIISLSACKKAYNPQITTTNHSCLLQTAVLAIT